VARLSLVPLEEGEAGRISAAMLRIFSNFTQSAEIEAFFSKCYSNKERSVKELLGILASETVPNFGQMKKLLLQVYCPLLARV
jgi:hypothetical protein